MYDFINKTHFNDFGFEWKFRIRGEFGANTTEHKLIIESFSESIEKLKLGT